MTEAHFAGRRSSPTRTHKEATKALQQQLKGGQASGQGSAVASWAVDNCPVTDDAALQEAGFFCVLIQLTLVNACA